MTTRLDSIQQAADEPCEMCGDAVTDGGSGRQHDTYDCAVFLRSRIAELEAALGRAEAELADVHQLDLHALTSGDLWSSSFGKKTRWSCYVGFTRATDGHEHAGAARRAAIVEFGLISGGKTDG